MPCDNCDDEGCRHCQDQTAEGRSNGGTRPFALFCGDACYPSGGWKDFNGTFSSKEEAIVAAANKSSCDWWQVVDLMTESIIEEGSRG